ncbi:MAG: Hsp20/alpha crystallin family protein [Deltaproteobacteria bacterium]|nr:Hsp20/alpha crystallin family protein [Deltaproteobacteria bacterium]
MGRPFFGWPLAGWREFDELDRLRRRLDALSETIWPAAGAAGVYPLFNITEDADNYYVRAELPGMTGSDLDIKVTGRALSISGQRKAETDPEASYHRRERRSGTFDRTITLPAEVDADKVDARMKNGILTVTLPKAAHAKPRQIKVKS